MKAGKVLGQYGIPIEMWRCAGNVAIVYFRSNKMREEWRKSTIVYILKDKGDIQSCTDNQGIKLMSQYSETLGESDCASLEKRDEHYKKQFGLTHGMSTIKAIFLLHHLTKRYMSRRRIRICFLLTWRRVMRRYQGT